MPVKDTAQYVGKTIQSILDQSFENWELIAVNDQSNDDSLAVMESFNDPRIIVKTNPNAGLLRALRFGYSLSSGDLITRMDSDDLMPDYKLEIMYNEWKKHGKGTVITGGAEYFMDEGEVGDGFNRYVNWLTMISRTNTHAQHIYKESVIASNCSLVHRDDFDACGGFEPDTFPEDYDLCFRFYESGFHLVGVNEIVHLWRDREDRISRNWDEYKDNRFLALKTHYFDKLERDSNRPLVIWGAGRNGKDIVRLMQEKGESSIHWICDNENKIGKDIYDIRMQHFDALKLIDNPQVIIAVASPADQNMIESHLKYLNKVAGSDYWFFS